jgi:hypothetical protein
MIKKIESLLNAEDVLNRLMSNPSTKYIDCSVECYQNGREQGFLLWGFKQSFKAIYFANGRGGDTIRVYVGDYSMQFISENAYENSWTSNTNEGAISYIIKQMKILNKKERKTKNV